ncbi:hypothetical protein [Pseudonocardia sp. ICBG1293]|uniref:hypothetical protein n=1 Tax=Pseudonocardia sp. ICBG1293 TaxID=2844382 RepID=UPI001CCBB1FD|nr:hypothetical protein [Pseudonocardia sp. ICBG1293]
MRGSPAPSTLQLGNEPRPSGRLYAGPRGEHLTGRIEAIADSIDHGTTTALETMHRGFTILTHALPDLSLAP